MAKSTNKRARRSVLVLKIFCGSFFAFVSLLVVLARIVDRKVQFRKTDGQIQSFFRDNGLQGTVGYFYGGNRRLRYVSAGSDTLPLLFFLHGSPSSSSIYEPFLKDTLFRKTFQMVAVDRPGYGGSGFGDPEPSVEKQASMIWPLLDSLNHHRYTHSVSRPVLIFGGSYGTTVACRLVMDHPNATDALVLIAPSLAPGQEKVFAFAPLIEQPWLRWAVPRLFQSANTEKLAHFAQLKEMQPLWHRIKVPVFYLQGEKDRLIYPSNAAFARTHLTAAPYINIEFLPGRPHFFIRSDKAAVDRTIMAAYKMALHPGNVR